MADVTLRMGPAQGSVGLPDRLVWVGDSISAQCATPGSPEDQASVDAFQRWGDLMALELANYGVDRYTADWDSVAGSDAPSYGSSPADWVYHDLSVGGATASTWSGTSKANSVTSNGIGGYATPITILVVQFGYNDFTGPNSTSSATFTTNLVTRLDQWTNVAYKFILMSWLPTVNATTLQAWHDAAVSAAATAEPGDRQSAVEFFNVGGSTCGSNPNITGSPTPDEYSYDGTHINVAGAQFHHDTLWPQIKAAL